MDGLSVPVPLVSFLRSYIMKWRKSKFEDLVFCAYCGKGGYCLCAEDWTDDAINDCLTCKKNCIGSSLISIGFCSRACMNQLYNDYNAPL